MSPRKYLNLKLKVFLNRNLPSKLSAMRTFQRDLCKLGALGPTAFVKTAPANWNWFKNHVCIQEGVKRGLVVVWIRLVVTHYLLLFRDSEIARWWNGNAVPKQPPATSIRIASLSFLLLNSGWHTAAIVKAAVAVLTVSLFGGVVWSSNLVFKKGEQKIANKSNERKHVRKAPALRRDFAS